MAEGIDAAAHRGALDVRGATIAVLPGPAQLPRPAANAVLHRELLRGGVVLSEVGPDVLPRSWMFAARNRIIAGLSRMTIVVQAGPGSGSLLTSIASQALSRPVGAVPGQVTSRLAEGSNQLIADGARLIRGAQDVLDMLYGIGAHRVTVDSRPAPTPDQAALLAAISEGLSTPEALVRAGIAGDHCLAELMRLELAGRVRRGAGGLLTVLP
jgi:DNA processing protein